MRLARTFACKVASKSTAHLILLCLLAGCESSTAYFAVDSQADNLYYARAVYGILWNNEANKREYFRSNAERLCRENHNGAAYRIVQGPTPWGRQLNGTIECLVEGGQSVGGSDALPNRVFLNAGGQRLFLNVGLTYIIDINGKPASEYRGYGCVAGIDPPCRETQEPGHPRNGVSLPLGTYEIVLARGTLYTGYGATHVLEDEVFRQTLRVTFSDDDVRRPHHGNIDWSEGRYWPYIFRNECLEGRLVPKVVAGEAPPDFFERYKDSYFGCDDMPPAS